ncbi:MAG TPA: hypothetical protein VLC98_16290 [Phnomibacter sp.]|nr:hypothetical protein [Phnomibacter sp.]
MNAKVFFTRVAEIFVVALAANILVSAFSSYFIHHTPLQIEWGKTLSLSLALAIILPLMKRGRK